MEEEVNRVDYQRICDRIARKAIRYAKTMAAEDETDLPLKQRREHWINVYLDESLPEFDADALLETTSHADAFEKSSGRPAPSRDIAARHAFQADVWAAISRVEGASL